MAHGRFSLRLWMLMAFVALVAVGLGGLRLKRASDSYRRRAIYHAQMETARRADQRRWEGSSRDPKVVEAEIREARAKVESLRRSVRESPDPIDDDRKTHNLGSLIRAVRSIQDSHAKNQKVLDEAYDLDRKTLMEEMFQEISVAQARKAKALADHHADLRQKYERAASRPWLPLSPDPPAPN
ncbi:MAG TPA: hypothetical protein VG406_12130 [Isosphaeraceae bacterium]|jgi:hypothetical protein|nr:hypothetical protein [Isosphaeraceae bacterium]